MADIVTDYLVVGAGISGLSFVDELFTQTTDTTITIVDKRPAAGGQWLDSYPHVKLHQPAGQYGVNSKELSNGLIDSRGPNKGLYDLASRPEIQAYCHTLMRDRFLPSGRVTFLPCTEYLEDGTLRRQPSGQILTVKINKKLVDAAYYTNVLPVNHTRSFATVDVTCVPPNDLPKLASGVKNFTVLGAGKTAMDSVIWLLEEDIDPSRIRWIVPADYWFYNRAVLQGTPDTFVSGIEAFSAIFEGIATAKTSRDIALSYEKAGVWLRLDPNIEPKQFHAATLAPAEVEQLRRVKDIVRGGHVTKIEPNQLTLTSQTIPADPDTLYVDCTATCLPDKPSQVIFQPGKIVTQIIRYPLIGYSCAKIAFLESLPHLTDEQRNAFAKPIRYAKNLDGFVLAMGDDLAMRAAENQDETLQRWMATSRLDTWTPLVAGIKPEEKEKQELVQRMQAGFMAAYGNIDNVIKSLEEEPVYAGGAQIKVA